MKKVSRRALFALALAIVLATGTLAFCVKYAVNADKWVTFSGSPHVYTGTNLTGGKIYDRTGARILNTTDGRVYSSDAAVRAATVHLLGDRYGYISAPLLGNFAEQMIGYDKITGLSEASKGTASARLTISADVQKAALQALGSYHGTVGVYNYKTGEILCAVTSPSYDPDNIPDIAGDETGDYDGVYLNRFFDAAYTPGSIFKLVTSAAALEADAASKDQTYTCTGETIIGGQEIICMGEHGTLSMTQALAHSCNVYYGELAAALGKDKLQAAADRLGLNGTLRCDGYTARSTVDLSDADEGSVAWAGIGQYTDQVTALQFLRFMGVIAGGRAGAPGGPPPSTTRITSPLLMRSPTLTLTALTTPPVLAGISIEALSDSTVMRLCSALTVSPTATSTSMTSTSLKSPMSGTVTSTGPLAAAGAGASALGASALVSGALVSGAGAAGALAAGASAAAASTSRITLPSATLSPTLTLTDLTTPP